MKKTTAIISAILLCSTVLTSCAGELVTLKYEDGKMQNKSAKLEYYPAPTNYEPESVGEPFAYYKRSDMTLYEITGLEPKEWLTQEYAGTATTIFYNTSITLPSLVEIDPDKLYICSNEEITYAVALVENKEIIDSLVDIFTNGEAVEWPLVDSITIYEMKFSSEENFPHVYYNLTYGEFPEGKFLYDRNTKRCVEIGDILNGYIS